MYKILTGIITSRLQNLVTDNDNQNDEQTGCTKKSYGTKEPLINKMIVENSRRAQKEPMYDLDRL